MNTIKNNRLKMYLAIRVLVKSNRAIMAKLPNAEEYITALSALISAIEEDATLLEAGTSELSEQKRQLKDELAVCMADNASKLKAYASYKGDTVLAEFSNTTEKILKKTDDLELVRYGKALGEKIQAQLTELSKYGLTADTQSTLSGLLTAYESKNPELTKAESDLKQVRAAYDESFVKADSLIRKLDNEVEIIRVSDPQFYAQYKEVRKVDYRVDKNDLTAQINDSETGAGIPNATVTFQGSQQPEPVTRTTAAKGGLRLKNIEPDIYTVTISKLGYTTQTLTITVTGDEPPYSLAVKLVKNA